MTLQPPSPGSSIQPITPHPLPSRNVRQHEPEATSVIPEYLRMLARHRGLILGVSALGLLAAVLFNLLTQPVYRSRTSLDIQGVNGAFMNQGALDPTFAGASGESMIQTQIKLLQSDSLLDRVRQRLTIEDHPAQVPRMDLLSRTERLLHLPERSPIPFQDLLDETSLDFKVKPLGITRLVEITCDSWDTDFAARFCNTLTSEFQAEDMESRGADAKRVSDWLMRQANDVRQKAIDSQQQLIAATGGNGLVLSQQADVIGADHLRQMQAELVKAQADRMEKEAEVSVASTADPDSSPSVIGDPAYAAATNRLADLQAQVAALVPPLTEANPKVIHLRYQIKQVQEMLVHDRAASAQRLQGEFNAAKHREDLLSLAFQSQEQTVSTDLTKGSQVALLRREVESEQQLYQTLLERAKEAGFASAAQASTVRVVDPARPPLLAVFPQRIKADIIGTLLGLFVALAWTFFRERSRLLIHLPGDSERLLDVAELGVIPSPKATPAMPGMRRPTVLSISPGGTGAQPTRSSKRRRGANVVNWNEKFSLAAEAYRSATLSLLLGTRVEGARAFVVSSPNPGDGKSTVTANLGIALAQSKMRVVLIDGDLRKPNLHNMFRMSNSKGLRNILRGECGLSSLEISSVYSHTEYPNLVLITSGTGSESVGELAHSVHLKALLPALARDFDVILIDTPPMLHIADARILAGLTHGAILVFRSGVTTRDQAATSRDLFDRDRIRVIGSILNDFNPGKQGAFNFYSSYHAYHTAADGGDSIAVGL